MYHLAGLQEANCLKRNEIFMNLLFTTLTNIACMGTEQPVHMQAVVAILEAGTTIGSGPSGFDIEQVHGISALEVSKTRP